MCLQKPKRISMFFLFVWFGFFFSLRYTDDVCCGVLRFGISFLCKWIQKRKTHLSSDLKVQSCVEAMEKTFPSKL